jgi:hypothetical protein
MNAQDRAKNKRWLAGERIQELAFLYNSLVEIRLPDGEKKKGAIVAASVEGAEPIYTVEAYDDSGDHECPESTIRAILPEEPIQPPQTTTGSSAPDRV